MTTLNHKSWEDVVVDILFPVYNFAHKLYWRVVLWYDQRKSEKARCRKCKQDANMRSCPGYCPRQY